MNRPDRRRDGVRIRSHRSEAGYTLVELMVSVAILLTVSGTVMKGVLGLTKTNQTVSNRSEMHAGVRNATELMQQEVGQAGRIAFPNLVRLAAAITTTGTVVATLKAVDSTGATLTGVNPTASLFVGEQIVVDTGSNEETVTITAVSSTNKTITASFSLSHLASVPVNVYGGFSSGVIPTTVTNGSTGYVMKMVGDINSDGQLQYVEYKCDTAGGNLYRRAMAFDVSTKPTLTTSMALLNNITANPDGTPCFTYQVKTVNNVPYVVDVAITLTVQTTDKDPLTGLYQTETKALLNVSPRNVFNVWQLAGLGVSNRVQPLPSTVTTLMGQS